MNRLPAGKDKASSHGFTLIELLVVIAILAALLLPALHRAKLQAQGIQCMNCPRQLALAWRMYTDDNRDLLLYASGNITGLEPGVWMSGTMEFDPGNPSNWDPRVDIYQSPMWPYCGENPTIFKCPADRPYVVVNGQNKPRVRAMVMNLYLGGFDGSGDGVFDDAAWQLYKKCSNLNKPGPEKIFVFLDEREDAINWGNFYTDNERLPHTDHGWQFGSIYMGGYARNVPRQCLWILLCGQSRGTAEVARPAHLPTAQGGEPDL